MQITIEVFFFLLNIVFIEEHSREPTVKGDRGGTGLAHDPERTNLYVGFNTLVSMPQLRPGHFSRDSP